MKVCPACTTPHYTEKCPKCFVKFELAGMIQVFEKMERGEELTLPERLKAQNIKGMLIDKYKEVSE